MTPKTAGAETRAAILAGTIVATPVPPSIVALRVPVIERKFVLHQPPLDVEVFRYRVLADGGIIPLHSVWRRCRHLAEPRRSPWKSS